VADNGSKTAPVTKADLAPWTVQDTTCVAGGPRRTHEIIVDGLIKPCTFEYGIPLPLPESHACKFVHIPEFIVTNAEGKRVKPAIPITAGFDASGKFALAEDQCVARLDELSMESLLARAAPLVGGEKMTLKTGKATVIAFLIESRKKKLVQNISQAKPEPDEMSDLELQRMAELEGV
jgi:hypothetical protein